MKLKNPFQIPRRKKKKKCVFLDDEVDVENETNDEDDDSDELDSSDETFIDDSEALNVGYNYNARRKIEIEVNKEKLSKFLSSSDTKLLAEIGLRFNYSNLNDILWMTYSQIDL